MLQSIFEIVLANAVLAGVLAVGVGLFARHCRRPAIVHTLWLLVFLKLITPPIVTLPLPLLPAPPQAPMAPVTVIRPVETHAVPASPPAPRAAPVPAKQPTPMPQPSTSFSVADYALEILVGISCVGTLSWLLLLIVRSGRFHRTARRAALAPAAIQQQTQQLAAALDVKNIPEVRIIRAHVSPLLWRIGGKPVILLPAELLASLSPPQVAGVLAHELAHLRRGDHWIRRGVLCVTALYWWHPAVWWGRRGLDQAAEQCCDQAVINQFPERRRDYASAL